MAAAFIGGGVGGVGGVGGRGRAGIGGGGPPPMPPADYIVTTDAEWDAVMANSAATLSGKVLEISGTNFTKRVITNKDMHNNGGAPLVIRSADANSKLPCLEFTGTVRGVDCNGLHIQMTGWPANHLGCVLFGAGTFGKLWFRNGTSFRHGYGPSQLDFDTDFDYPEYQRVNNVRTATTTSAAYPLNWLDPARTSGWVEFFNRGAQTVYVRLGNSGVVATAADHACAPGARVRLTVTAPSGGAIINPTIHTHFAVLAASGTSEVNARSEIGLGVYLASAFSSVGNAVLEDIFIEGAVFRDLNNGLKSLSPTMLSWADRCDLDRIYQDVEAVSPAPGVPYFCTRNIGCVSFSRSGIAENLNGDARDPHGDLFGQKFGTGVGTMGPIYYAGNATRVGALRAGVVQQGAFISDNDFNPSYSGVFVIASILAGGLTNGIAAGEPGFPAEDFLLFGNTIIDWSNIANTATSIRINATNGGSIYTGYNVTGRLNSEQATIMDDENTLLVNVASPAAVFPNFANLTAATTRAAMEAALTTAAEGVGRGAVAHKDAVDWVTSDPTACIRWENVPSGAAWNDLVNQPANTPVALGPRKILNPRAAQAVSVGAGTEWRKLGTDGTTVLVDWGTAAGTIEPGQYIDVRRTTGAGGATVQASVNINGFSQTVNLLSATVPPQYLEITATPVGFVDPANVPAGTHTIRFEGKIWFGSATNNQIFSQESTGCDLLHQTTGTARATVEDSTGASMIGTAFTIAPAGSLPAGQWLDIIYEASHATQLVTLTINGVTFTKAFDVAGTGTFQSNREVSFLCTTALGLPLPVGTRFADLRVFFNGTLRKAIPNVLADANSDPWRVGAGTLVQGP